MSAQAAFAATLVDEWVRAGVSDVVLAPGSRSTPLALALADAEDAGRLRAHVHLDERSAGFFALGVAVASGRPAPVLVTSGTAAAELLPPVVEAHYSRVPMIMCTADRPPELHDVGAPQAIEQGRLFEGFLRWRFDPGAVGDVPPAAWRSIAARSVAAAVHAPSGPGPVHLNLGFRDPLVASAGALMPPGRAPGRSWHEVAGGGGSTAEVTAGAVALLSGRPGVIVAGAGVDDPGAVSALAAALRWPVLAAPASGCRGTAGDPATGPVGVTAFDAILRSPVAAARLRPEVVLRLGAPPASKVLAAWLEAAGADQVAVDPHGAWVDPERTASLVVATAPGALCRALAAAAPAPGPAGWAAAWRVAEADAHEAIAAVLSEHPEVTEPGVARAVTSTLGADATLVVASSMPVRDVEWYGDPAMSCRVVANRGANGIDGLVSTALGVAAATRGPTVALVGDLAFLHDSGGLLGAVGRGAGCTFVVVDNGGGGIFGFLPQSALLAQERFERLFGTPHGIDIGALAAVHGIPSSAPQRAAEVGPAIAAAMDEGGVGLVIVRTDRVANVAVHDELAAAVVDALAAGGPQRGPGRLRVGPGRPAGPGA